MYPHKIDFVLQIVIDFFTYTYKNTEAFFTFDICLLKIKLVFLEKVGRQMQVCCLLEYTEYCF